MRRGAKTVRNDEKQGRLWLLFLKLRRIKMVELPRLDMLDPASRGMNEMRIREAIRKVEMEIEQCLNG